VNPPWITLWNAINASVGNDAAVTVSALDKSILPYVVPIKVRSKRRAIALASLMKLRHDFGNVAVIIVVKDGAGNVPTPVVPRSASELAGLVSTAFRSNGWFRGVAVRDLMGRKRVFQIFAKRVIQFHNDDLSDLYGNYNNVAASVFADVLLSRPGGFRLMCSTAKR
jgi:hypothetical protein